MRSCRDPQRPQICEPQVVQNGEPLPCEPFAICIGNYTLNYDGACLFLDERQYRIPDGTYSTITFQDGCIVDVGSIPAPTYTPSECCGAPGGGGGGGSADIPISGDASNLLTMRPDGLYVTEYFKPGNGITITGAGTVNDPRVITAQQQAQQGISVSTPAPLEHSGDGSSTAALVIRMQPGPLMPGVYGEYEVDAYGRVVDYIPGSVSEMTITPVSPVAAQKLGTNNWQVSLEIPQPSPEGTFELGPYELTISMYGTIVAATRKRPLITPGRFYTPEYTTTGGETIPAKIVAYDADGFIIDVANA